MQKNNTKKHFDCAVIGTGSAGSTVAYRCRSAGWRVAIIDELPFGGTCALRGCDPKKILVGAADLIDWSRRMSKNGVAGDLRIQWQDLMRFKKTFTDPIPQNREEGYNKEGIAVFHGAAEFTGAAALAIGNEELTANHIVIATGAKPMKLGIKGEEHLTASDAFLELKELPGRIIFVGGGYISFEFAHIAARAGAHITILHRGSRPLEGFDSDLVAKLVDASREIGIDLRLNTAVEEIEKATDGFIAHAVTGGNTQTVTGDCIVHGAGRAPAIAGLNLEKAGIDYDTRGIVVNEYLQSVSNPAVYSAGDAIMLPGGFPLTPVAGHEGEIVAANLLAGNHATPDYSGLPSVVFTVPPLAMVGWHEEAARKENLKFIVQHEDTSLWYSSRRVGESHSGFKVLVEEGSGRILGAHLLGPHADETINLFALAIRHNLTASDIKKMLWAYPTHASDIRYMV